MSWLFRRKTKNPMKVALCIGHSRYINGRMDGGAVSVGGVSEWDYNIELGRMVKRNLERYGHEAEAIADYGSRGYTEAIRFASERVEAYGADVTLELHFNAAHGNVRGHEWLHLAGSDNSLLLASALEGQFKRRLPELKSRGVKPRGPKDRGYAFCKYTPCPAVVCEPFFGSNKQDWAIAVAKKSVIADCYTEALVEWWKAKSKNV